MTKKDIAQAVAARTDVSAAIAEEIIGAALDVSGPERTRRSEALRTASLARCPADWLADQLTAAR